MDAICIDLQIQLGVNDAFSNYADFKSISTEQNLKVSAISHAAAIEVTHEGTVGAAATGEYLLSFFNL